MPRPVTPNATLAIKAEATRLGWPVHFATDLDHDARVIATMLPREPFSWCCRPDGTHIGRAVEPSRSTLTMTMVGEAFRDSMFRFYIWDGVALHAMPSAEATDRRLAELTGARFVVRTARQSSLMPHRLATRRDADSVADNCRTRYGEEFITVDEWEARSIRQIG